MNYCILFIVLFCSLLHGTLSAATSVDFSKDSLIHFPLLNQEEDQIRIEKSKIPGKEKTGISFSWGTRHYHYTQTGISKKPLPQFEKFQKLELALNVFIEPGSSVSQFGLRFRDSQGEIFQISSGRLPAGTHGNQKVHLVFDAEKVPHSWGKKINRKIDWPLTLFSMTVSYPPQSGKGKIIFESIETFLPDRLLESVEVKVDTGHPLHLLFPRKAPPATFIPEYPEPFDLFSDGMESFRFFRQKPGDLPGKAKPVSRKFRHHLHSLEAESWNLLRQLQIEGNRRFRRICWQMLFCFNKSSRQKKYSRKRIPVRSLFTSGTNQSGRTGTGGARSFSLRGQISAYRHFLGKLGTKKRKTRLFPF